MFHYLQSSAVQTITILLFCTFSKEYAIYITILLVCLNQKHKSYLQKSGNTSFDSLQSAGINPQICRMFTNKHDNRNQLSQGVTEDRRKTPQYCRHPILIKTSPAGVPPRNRAIYLMRHFMPILILIPVVCEPGYGRDTPADPCSVCLKGFYRENEGNGSCVAW